MLREKAANFRQKNSYYRALVTKKWITPVVKFTKENPVTLGVARIHVLFVFYCGKIRFFHNRKMHHVPYFNVTHLHQGRIQPIILEEAIIDVIN